MTSMTEFGARAAHKPATAARMYDYYLGGVHNFPADREAADAIIERYPFVPAAARANRAFLVNAVRFVAESGVRQFLDIGSGIPTMDNVHSVARRVHPDARVAYVDIDPVAVAESLELLEGDSLAVAVFGDAQRPQDIVEHAEVRRLLDFDRPIGVIMAAVLHFVPDHQVAEDAVAGLIAAVPAGSHFVMSHSATESFERDTRAEDVYQRRTSTPGTVRTHAETELLFAGLELLDPGVVWVDQWRPGSVAEPVDRPAAGGFWAGVGRKP